MGLNAKKELFPKKAKISFLDALSKKEDERFKQVTKELMQSKEVKEVFDALDYIRKFSKENPDFHASYLDRFCTTFNSFYAKHVKLLANKKYFDESNMYIELEWREDIEKYGYLLDQKKNNFENYVDNFVEDSYSLVSEISDITKKTREEDIITEILETDDWNLYHSVVGLLARAKNIVAELTTLGNSPYKPKLNEFVEDFESFKKYVEVKIMPVIDEKKKGEEKDENDKTEETQSTSYHG